MDIGSVISQYGYLAVFLGVILEGETVLLLAGYSAHRGYLDFSAVLGLAWLGVALVDQLYFWLGRRRGTRIAGQFPRLRGRIERAGLLIERHPVQVIFAMRFAFGLRIAAPIAVGMSSVSWRRYTLINLVSTAFWALAVGSAGYAFGALLNQLLERIEKYEHWVIIAAISFAVLVHLVMRQRATLR